MADWNKRYAEASAPLFGDAPNEYVREIMARSDVAPASALMIGDGDGRNGRWLASCGVAVTAVDISGVATEQARDKDARAGVSVARIVADLADWRPGTGRTWDASFIIYLQCEAAVRHRAAAVAGAATAPGGWFVAEGFAPAESESAALGPKDADLLYARDDILAALPDFTAVEALSGWTMLNEGVKHQGRGWVLRLLAKRS